ncbi:uncharacterized protein [Hetaerina americana]|uniref:uncharacterized protein n=1 Tax=Hetaerina americana TaxID=62018 RepID=UPI003A7F52CD
MSISNTSIASNVWDSSIEKMDSEEDFDKYADMMQKRHFQLQEGRKYDVLKPDQLCYFAKILSNFMPPKQAALISKKAAQSGTLFYRMIVVNCSTDSKFFSVPVVCIKRKENEVFYDIEGRLYESWIDFLSNNHLPKCLMKFPENGVYEIENTSEGRSSQKLKLEKRHSPACSMLKAGHKALKYIAKITAILAVPACDLEFLKPYNTAICIVSGISNAYTGISHASELYDCYKHGDGLKSGEAFGNWMGLAEDALLFTITVGKVKFGTPQSDVIVYQNMLKMVTSSVGSENPMSRMKKIQNILIYNHLSDYSEKAVEYIELNILKSKLDLKDLLFNVRKYVLNDNSPLQKYRQLVHVDYDIVSTVAQDMARAQEIPQLMSMELYTSINVFDETIHKIINELKYWINGNASDMQVVFRVSGLCKNLKTYETPEEMCKHFEVSQPDDVRVNDRCIFEGPGGKILELQKLYDVKKFPQFLSYAVEYLRNGNDDVEEFKKCFNDRIVKEMFMDKWLQPSFNEREWINALTLDNLSYTQSVPHTKLTLVKPKPTSRTEITQSDLFKLAKRLLGRVGDVDMKLIRPDMEWVVVAMREHRLAVIIAPKLDVKNLPVSGCYPVFVTPL